MKSSGRALETPPAFLNRRTFLFVSGAGVVGLALFPLDSAHASPVFGAVAKFANAVGASPVAGGVLDYLTRSELEKKTAREVARVNTVIGRHGFSDLSESTVYVPAADRTYFFYAARHKDQFNAMVNFFDGERKSGSKLICALDGPTLFGIAELAASIAQKNSREVAKQTLLPRNKVSISHGQLNKSYKQANIYRTDAGTVRVAYKTDGKGKGLVTVEAKNGRGTLLAGGDYELGYQLDAPRQPVV